MTDWNEIGARAYNRCFNNFRKTEDFDESFECFDEEIVNGMENGKIEFEYGWEHDLSTDQISQIISAAVKQFKDNKNEDLSGPLHTYLHDKLYDAQEKHGGDDQFTKWNKTLNEMLDD